MGFKVKKEEKSSGATGSIDSLPAKDKLSVIKVAFKVATCATPVYDELEDELNGYSIELLEDVNSLDLDKINTLYAHSQAYFSRTSTIERIAVNNLANWENVCNYMKAYMEDKAADLLLSEEMVDLKTVLQEAKIKKEMRKELETYRKIQASMVKAKSFLRSSEIKKKELTTAMTNLNRQATNIRSEKEQY